MVRAIVEGSPPMQLVLTIGTGEPPAQGTTSDGHLAIAMSAIRAAPYVLEAPPGVVTAPVFGAYRWPA